jgi:hypothetical protein
MRLALMGAIAAVAGTFATAALAQAVSHEPLYRSQFYSPGSGNPYIDDGRRNWQSGYAMLLHHAYEPDRYRYHGGPKSND